MKVVPGKIRKDHWTKQEFADQTLLKICCWRHWEFFWAELDVQIEGGSVKMGVEGGTVGAVPRRVRQAPAYQGTRLWGLFPAL